MSGNFADLTDELTQIVCHVAERIVQHTDFIRSLDRQCRFAQIPLRDGRGKAGEILDRYGDQARDVEENAREDDERGDCNTDHDAEEGARGGKDLGLRHAQDKNPARITDRGRGVKTIRALAEGGRPGKECRGKRLELRLVHGRNTVVDRVFFMIDKIAVLREEECLARVVDFCLGEHVGDEAEVQIAARDADDGIAVADGGAKAHDGHTVGGLVDGGLADLVRGERIFVPAARRRVEIARYIISCTVDERLIGETHKEIGVLRRKLLCTKRHVLIGGGFCTP